MAALINTYFHKNKLNEQELINGLIKESIQVQGNTYYYLPREVQIQNLVLGEDVVSKFSIAIPLEMYLEDAQGFQGDKEMFSKFGLEIRNSYKLVISKDRWEEEVKSRFDDGITGKLLLENGNKVVLEQGGYVLNEIINDEAPFDIVNYIRPREGDLIFDPMTKFLMEIKFVDHDVEFFSLGRNYKYHLSCEAFQYQQEIIETGYEEIDLFGDNSRDQLQNQLLLENGDAIVFEQGGYALLESGNDTSLPIRESGVNFSPDATRIKVAITNPFD